jgi:large subunit ribosomal protein L4
LAHQRQGTHDSKERSDIMGSTRKIKRQKGTGTARAGSIKNPLFRGGGRVFGPHPHEYRIKLNKKVKQLARLSALTYKAKDKDILVIEDFKMEAPKTKDYLRILDSLKVNDQRTLLVVNDADNNLYLSTRNLQNAKVIRTETLNTYEILHANKILFVESSLKAIKEVFSK